MTNKAKVGEFCWNELVTTDVDKCKKFYSSLFGWEMHDHDLGECTYTILKQSGQDVGGMMQIPQEHQGQIPPHWMSYVSVADLDASVAKAKSLGANIKQEPMSVGEFGRFAVLQDPSGAHIALWQSTKV
jgi:uncharacterized protein